MRVRYPVLLAAAALVAGSGALPGPIRASDDPLAQSRAVYAALKSYADTGTVLQEFGPAAAPVRERHAFKTYYRAPRHFFFDFTKGEKPGGIRFVIWGDGEAFHTWWSTTGLEETYPRGSGARAFVLSTHPTVGSSVLISPLLFAGAGLIGTLEELANVSLQGTETIGGRQCHKLAGVARSRYATGHEVNIRRTTVWIDVQSLLVRRVFEDTPRGTPAGSVSRVTTTFEPQANPTLDSSRFRFAVPSPQE